MGTNVHPVPTKNNAHETRIRCIMKTKTQRGNIHIHMGVTMGRKTVKITIQFDDDDRDDYVARHPAFSGELADVITGVRKRANFAFAGWQRVIIIWDRKRVIVQPM